MHNKFYASGFLYHPKSQQILLQQDSVTQTYSLFEGINQGEEGPEETFRNIIFEDLHLELKPTKIYPIYRYFNDGKNANNFTYYGLVRKLEKIEKTKKIVFSWFTFKQIQKLQLSEQIKHDIVVGQRVIDSEMRKVLGQQTIG